MLLERAATFFQAQGYQVKVNPCIIGDSGAIHSPDLALVRPGERDRVVFVLDELDGHGPLESRIGMAKDMGCEPLFVIGEPGPEVQQWADRHHRKLITAGDLGGVTQPAPAPLSAATEALRLAIPEAASEGPMPTPASGPAIPEDDGGAELIVIRPSKPRNPERALAAFTEEDMPADGGAMLLPSTPRADAPTARPKPSKPLSTAIPEDGGAMLLPSRPTPARAPAPPPEPALAADDHTEILASSPSQGSNDPDKFLKHDLSIWNPAARLALVKQAAKAQSFEATGVQQGLQSAWLGKLRKP